MNMLIIVANGKLRNQRKICMNLIYNSVIFYVSLSQCRKGEKNFRDTQLCDISYRFTTKKAERRLPASANFRLTLFRESSISLGARFKLEKKKILCQLFEYDVDATLLSKYKIRIIKEGAAYYNPFADIHRLQRIINKLKNDNYRKLLH